MIYQFPYNMMHWLGMTMVAGIMSLLVGAVFWDVRSATTQHQESVNNRAGFHYAMAALGLWPVLLMAISEVWRDKPAVARDIGDGLYSRGIYIITKVSLFIFFYLLRIVLFFCFCFYIGGLCFLYMVSRYEYERICIERCTL